jgi:hypothetical protein
MPEMVSTPKSTVEMNPRRRVDRNESTSRGTFTGYRWRKKFWKEVKARPRGVDGDG